ncbi:M20/M25/M40 family metallo-hydrolase, partial [Bacteroidota bacterium]
LEFSCEVFPQVEIGNILFFSNTHESLYDVLLLANLDNSTKIGKQEYFSKTEQRYYGTGIWEHKGGIASMIIALQALKYTRLLKKVKVGVLLTSDDSLQGAASKTIIKQKSSQSKNILGLHGAFLNGGIVTSRSGSAVYKCSMNLRKTDNAINVSKAISSFTKLITQWSDLSNIEKGLVVSPGNVSINSNITEPYAHAETVLSIRFNYNNSIVDIDSKIKKLLPSKKIETFQYQFEGGLRRPAMEYTDKVNLLWEKISSIARQLDIRLQKEHRWSSADIAFADQDKHIIDGLGPIGIKEFNKSEYILKHSLIERASLLSMIINELKSN